MPTSRGRPKTADRYHHGDLRAALLREAGRVLATSGPEALSLRELARALGVSHNAPYKHFENRDALLAALAAEGFRELTADGQEAAGNAPPGEMMRSRALAYIRFALRRPAVFKLMFSRDVSSRTHAELSEAARNGFFVLRQALSGGASDRLANDTALAAWAFVHGIAHLLIDRQIPESLSAGRAPEELAREMMQAFSRPRREN
ncbi:MAG: WHG domain-containing protein [Alphaproteobacteria bacterium]|nr:WHG domain-containing protein [Alphaproteobacteria bacterium]MCW5741671.1 WHG domain-containing protein [Alphaproteobacteria bacterium]